MPQNISPSRREKISVIAQGELVERALWPQADRVLHFCGDVRDQVFLASTSHTWWAASRRHPELPMFSQWQQLTRKHIEEVLARTDGQYTSALCALAARPYTCARLTGLTLHCSTLCTSEKQDSLSEAVGHLLALCPHLADLELISSQVRNWWFLPPIINGLESNPSEVFSGLNQLRLNGDGRATIEMVCLHHLQNLSRLQLENLTFIGLPPNLEGYDFLPALRRLIFHRISESPDLENGLGMPRRTLARLTHLHIQHCFSMSEFFLATDMPMLVDLRIENCLQFTDAFLSLTGRDLSALKHLSFQGCKSMTNLHFALAGLQLNMLDTRETAIDLHTGQLIPRRAIATIGGGIVRWQ